MAATFFETYEQAASYAKQCAQKSGQPVKLERRPVKLERRNEEWVVYAPPFSQQPVSDSKPLPNPPPWFNDSFGQEYGVPRRLILAQEKLEREQRQREYADQKTYDETIKEITHRAKEGNCEACDRPVSFCRCGG